MPVVNYYSVNDRLVGYASEGQRMLFLSDAEGSVTAVADTEGNVVQSLRYKPYGEVLVSQGSDQDMSFRWNGTLGDWASDRIIFVLRSGVSRGLSSSYEPNTGRWISRYFGKSISGSYVYGYGNPISSQNAQPKTYPQLKNCEDLQKEDPTGYVNAANCLGKKLCGLFSSSDPDRATLLRIKKCYEENGIPTQGVNEEGKTVTFQDCLSAFCASSNYREVICTDCKADEDSRFPCTKVVCGREETNYIKVPACAESSCDNQQFNHWSGIYICKYWYDGSHDCLDKGGGCLQTLSENILHELLHVCGDCYPADGKDGHQERFNKATKCVAKALGCQ